MRGRVAIAQQPDAREAGAVAVEGYDPGKPAGSEAPAEVHLDVFERVERNLQLRAVHEHARQPKSERAGETVARAARQHGRARAD